MELWQLRPSDLITATEAATLAGVTPATIRQWATRGHIRRFPGRNNTEPTLYARPEIQARTHHPHSR